MAGNESPLSLSRRGYQSINSMIISILYHQKPKLTSQIHRNIHSCREMGSHAATLDFILACQYIWPGINGQCLVTIKFTNHFLKPCSNSLIELTNPLSVNRISANGPDWLMGSEWRRLGCAGNCIIHYCPLQSIMSQDSDTDAHLIPQIRPCTFNTQNQTHCSSFVVFHVVA